MITDEALKRLLAANEARMLRTQDGRDVLVRPDGAEHEVISPLDPPLLRIRQSVRMHDLSSFVSYVNEFKTSASRMFAEPSFLSARGASIVCILDYHEKSDPRHGAHVVTYELRQSDQWLRWMSACKEPLKQVAFAELVEECRADIVEPAAAKLLDIVRTFKAGKRVEYDSLVQQPNGSVRLAYSEEVQQKSGPSGELPEAMKLGVPVYFRGAAFAVGVMIRYRLKDGGVHFALQIDRPAVIEDEAFRGVCKDSQEGTGIPLHIGRAA